MHHLSDRSNWHRNLGLLPPRRDARRTWSLLECQKLLFPGTALRGCAQPPSSLWRSS